MKKTLLLAAATTLIACQACNEPTEQKEKHEAAASSADTAISQTKNSDAAMPDSAAMAKAWESFMTPGPMHQWMASADGKWKAEMRSWHSPDAPPSPPAKMDAEFKMILNGLYQQSQYRGEMMGMKFEGTGLMAYDNARKKFMSTWIDNMGSGMLQLEGDWDESTKTLTLSGPSTDPVSGEQTNFRQTLKVIDDKHQVMEMFGSHGKGLPEFKMLEIKLEKK